MNYELLKNLKDAGFPNSNEWIDNGNGFFVDKGELVYEVPTLSELIEACAGNLCCIRIFPENDLGEKEFGADTWVTNGITKHFYGSTLEEAVASLYLELNNKQNEK
jgi:hypothetical protein